MKKGALYGCYLWLLLAILALTTTRSSAQPAGCKYGQQKYSHLDYIPHPNNCTEFQCQYGRVIPVTEACDTQLDGQCHYVNSTTEYGNEQVRCIKSSQGEYTYIRSPTPTSPEASCKIGAITVSSGEYFISGDKCRLRQCQNGNAPFLVIGCPFRNRCYREREIWVNGSKTHTCIETDRNSFKVVKATECRYRDKIYKHLDAFIHSDNCTKLQCQFGLIATVQQQCGKQVDGQCHYQNFIFQYGDKQFQCIESSQDEYTYIESPIPTSPRAGCKVGKKHYKDGDIVESDDKCRYKQCQDGKSIFYISACPWKNGCYPVGLMWKGDDDVTRTCCRPNVSSFQVVKVSEE